MRNSANDDTLRPKKCKAATLAVGIGTPPPTTFQSEPGSLQELNTLCSISPITLN